MVAEAKADLASRQVACLQATSDAILPDPKRDGVDGKAHLDLLLAALYKALGDDGSLPVDAQ